jgi:hypothetical protein
MKGPEDTPVALNKSPPAATMDIVVNITMAIVITDA